MNKLKEIIKKNKVLYVLARNIYALQKGFVNLLKNKRGSQEHIKSTVSLIKKSDRIKGRPINITIEPANICNLKCPACECGMGILERKVGHITFEKFKIIIDKIAEHTNSLMYYFEGEPFLNKEWVKQVRYAKDKGIPYISTCTNCDYAKAQDIIDSHIDFVSFQFGGVSEKTHPIYRVGSDFNKVVKNLKELLKLRKEQNAFWLHIEIGLIVMKHNEHEVDSFIEFAKKLGVDSYNIVDPCVRSHAQGLELLPEDKKYWIYDEKAFSNGKLKRKFIPENDCPWIYYSMVITWDGNVVPCCHDPKATEIMGNIIEQDLEEIWNGEKYQNFRKRVHSNQKGIDICRLCSGYGISEIY